MAGNSRSMSAPCTRTIGRGAIIAVLFAACRSATPGTNAPAPEPTGLAWRTEPLTKRSMTLTREKMFPEARTLDISLEVPRALVQARAKLDAGLGIAAVFHCASDGVLVMVEHLPGQPTLAFQVKDI